MMNAFPVDGSFADNPEAWLEKQSEEHHLPYLLAHADDGVIWGRFDNDGKLILAGRAFSEVDGVDVKLRKKTLQQLRLFGRRGELFLWRTGNNLQVRLIIDDPIEEDTLEEVYLLWGEPSKTNMGFTLMHEGLQGLRHAPPLNILSEDPLGLKVRHYVKYDEIDQAYIAFSRLVGFDSLQHQPNQEG